MKLKNLHQHCKGLTLVEVLVIIVLLVILLFSLVIVIPECGSKSKAQRLQCANQLRQLCLATLVWAEDHESKFPSQVSTNQGGTLEHTRSKEIFRHFLAISNELGSPKVLFCPTDEERSRTDAFSSFNNQNLSYFLALNPTRSNVWSVLAGDRNVAANGQNYANGNYLIPANQSLSWGKGLHHPGGNLVFSDGRVEQCDNKTMIMHMSTSQQTTNWLAIP